MRIALFLMILAGLISCKNNRNDSKTSDKSSLIELKSDDSSNPIKDYFVKSIGTSNDFYEVTKNCALLLQQPDEMNDSLSNVEGFNELSDDENSASMNAYELLQEASIQAYETPKRFIRYISNGDTLIIDTQKKNDKLFGYYIFFNDKKSPLLLDCGLIDKLVINEYFKK